MIHIYWYESHSDFMAILILADFPLHVIFPMAPDRPYYHQ